MPGAPSSGMPRESQANFKVGTVWVLKKRPVGTGPVGSVSGKKFVLSGNVGYKTRAVTMLLNVVLTPGKPILKSNFRDGT